MSDNHTHSDTPSEALRRRGTAAALLVAPGLTLIASLVQQSPSAHDTASELASIAEAPGRAELSAGLGFVALALMVPALLGFARPLWDRSTRLALTGLSLGIVGVLGLTALMGSAPVTVAMVAASADRAEMVALTDRYEASALMGVWMVTMLVGYVLGPVIMGVAWWRVTGQWLVPVALVSGLVVQMADAGRWPLTVGYALTWLGLGCAGAALWRGRVGDRPEATRTPAVAVG